MSLRIRTGPWVYDMCNEIDSYAWLYIYILKSAGVVDVAIEEAVIKEVTLQQATRSAIDCFCDSLEMPWPPLDMWNELSHEEVPVSLHDGISKMMILIQRQLMFSCQVCCCSDVRGLAAAIDPQLKIWSADGTRSDLCPPRTRSMMLNTYSPLSPFTAKYWKKSHFSHQTSLLKDFHFDVTLLLVRRNTCPNEPSGTQIWALRNSSLPE